MPDIYLYEGTDVLKNLLDIRNRKLLEEAEADYMRISEIDLQCEDLIRRNQIHFLSHFSWRYV